MKILIKALYESHYIHKLSGKSKATTKITIVDVINYKWCTINVMPVVVFCKSDVVLITICYLNSCEICCVCSIIEC
jgi:hypothetical protein